MSGQLNPELSSTLDPDEQEGLRTLNRSPHPYHHQNFELLHPSDLVARDGAPASKTENDSSQPSLAGLTTFSKESTPISDSGTDADDEHFLKGLPAPRLRPHKGLKGRNELLSGTSTPLLSPAILEESSHGTGRRLAQPTKKVQEKGFLPDLVRRRKVILRRATEAGIVTTLALLIQANKQVSPVLRIWRKDLYLFGAFYTILLAVYPLRLVIWAYRNRNPGATIPLRVPIHFDPAPLLYPPAITIFVSLLVSVNNPAVILPNIILSISSIPQQVIPKFDYYATQDTLHWFLSCLPLIWQSHKFDSSRFLPTEPFLPAESLVLLYPLHRTVCAILHHLTTTSLLAAELQLLSIALINVLVLASSPQVQILKALLWGGGLSVLVLCGAVIRWGITLARVPKWRFQREPFSPRRPLWKSLLKPLSWRMLKGEILGTPFHHDSEETSYTTDEDEDTLILNGPTRVQSLNSAGDAPLQSIGRNSSPATENISKLSGVVQRHTFPHAEASTRRSSTHTPSGRKKRAASISVRPYFKLTQWQASIRKWMYAGYVYTCLVVIIVAVVRVYIERYALNGNEPIGWALGYFLGDIPWFRFQVVNANLERWICLPGRSAAVGKECHLGWVQHLRHDDFGEANTRILISGYWVAILIVGLATVFQLKDTVEVDTRRKVFHFMMVGMLLPTTYIDPTFVGLALSMVLAIFLILDLLRASQLPPLSKPIASFLAPYVDGRDFRGPVVISHIFLLIGCAIPIWLSLASLPRVGSGYMSGWEISTRDVSMVSGVICVGLGDAAASLVGRRYGHRKWLWGGGKSLEGSVAFTAAVFLGLTAADLWLRLGRWPVVGEQSSMFVSSAKVLGCASMASLTEAVLTGGNDNVIVPVILWTCVKALEI